MDTSLCDNVRPFRFFPTQTQIEFRYIHETFIGEPQFGNDYQSQ